MLIHLSRLTSFGLPYFSPFVPLNMEDFKDTIIRVPSWMMYKHSKNSPHYKQEKRSRKWKLDESEEPY